jgi:hypothetical protein
MYTLAFLLDSFPSHLITARCISYDIIRAGNQASSTFWSSRGSCSNTPSVRSEEVAMLTISILTAMQVYILSRAEDQVLRQSSMSLLRKEKSTVHFPG